MLRKNILVMFGLVLINAQAALSGAGLPKDVTYEPVSMKMSDLTADGNRYRIETDLVEKSAGFIVGGLWMSEFNLSKHPVMSTLGMLFMITRCFVDLDRFPGSDFSMGLCEGILSTVVVKGGVKIFSKCKLCTEKNANQVNQVFLRAGVVGHLAVIGEECIKPRVHVSYYPNKKTYDCNRLTGRCTLVEPSNQFRQTFGSAHK